MDKDIREKWTQYAQRNGFDSLQAYIRFIAKADIDGRRVDLAIDNWQPTPDEAKRLDKLAEEAERGSNVSKPFYTTEEALAYLHSL